ncbi:hypothetical protein LEM8419_00150 [Neolewinella maritima]|uniref:Carboxypeptidase regulatory-like domain-containing protein n=1 Tax=Neolewinella maritima TaxID=1383882 RepID=A0ABM9AVY1_9BACT|nr:carboxypeptidase-like regulatory domain-containing protein [Neolewinella maritima]CAH0998835.1 hypothetical protein LEM8419_00150 [Neolewinella maritima]
MQTINGKLVDQYGAPVADATLSIVRASAPVPDIAMLSDHAGRFYLDDFPNGSYRLQVTVDGISEAVDFTVPRPTASLTIRINR